MEQWRLGQSPLVKLRDDFLCYRRPQIDRGLFCSDDFSISMFQKIKDFWNVHFQKAFEYLLVDIDTQRGNQMKKFATITGAALLAASLAGAAFAQSGANPSAPQPNSMGTGTTTPGTKASGEATDSKMKSGTTGSAIKSGNSMSDTKDGMKSQNK
jgi:hypothetical protein